MDPDIVTPWLKRRERETVYEVGIEAAQYRVACAVIEHITVALVKASKQTLYEGFDEIAA